MIFLKPLEQISLLFNKLKQNQHETFGIMANWIQTMSGLIIFSLAPFYDY